MDDWVEIQCPWCGEIFDAGVAVEDVGERIEDCAVCCNPCRIVVRRDAWGDPQVEVEQA